MKRTITTVALVLALIGFIVLGTTNITRTNHKLKTQDIQLKSKQSDLLELENKFNLLNKQLEDKNITEQKLKELEQQKADLQKQLDQAQKDLQAKAKAKAEAQAKIAQAASMSAKAYAATPCGDNEYAQFIYQHESGCRINAVNSIGCKGIGQRCGDWNCSLDDYVCQNNWFTNYAISRYGSWYNAYVFWQANRWW